MPRWITTQLVKEKTMYSIDSYIPTRIVFGAGRLKELATIRLPGKKALVCVTSDGLMEKLGIQQRVLQLLSDNGVATVVFDEITPNPTLTGVMKAAAVAKDKNCDFVLGLGGGSSIDTAKATAIMMANPGNLWDYASAGTGGRKQVKNAVPVVTVSTTSGTGTEADPYCVITREETWEKLDFALDEIFPVLSIIDPELMCSLPRSLTIFQGFDALFHAAECYITNNHSNRLVDIYAQDAVCHVAENLTRVLSNPNDIEARTNMAYAADILCGYTQSLICTTSHHIIGQAIGGVFPQVPHGATLILIAQQYYNRVCRYFPVLFDELGEMMGQARDVLQPGAGFGIALEKLLAETGADQLTMAQFGITEDKLPTVAKNSAEVVGFDCDRYESSLTTADVLEILESSLRA